MRANLLSTVVVTLLAANAAAEPDAVEVLDEAGFIAAVEASDPARERVAAMLDDAAAEVAQAGLRAEPRIAIDREEVFPSGGGQATDYLRLVLPLDLSGRRGRRVTAAERSLAAARAASELEHVARIVDRGRVFRDAAYLRLRVALMTTARAGLARGVDIVTKRARAGDAAGYDQQRLQLELGAYDDALASATLALHVAQRRLALLAGRRGERLDAAGTLEIPPEPPELAAMLADALARRGDYRAARLRIEAAVAEHAAADRGWIPNLELTGGLMSAQLGTGRATGYVAGLAFNVPVFDRGGVAGARAAAAHRAATAEARWLERQVPEAIRITYETWTARRAQARAFQANQLARLEPLLRSAEASYREGAGTVVDLLDAYRSTRDAQLRDLELRHEASLAELDLWLALGRRP